MHLIQKIMDSKQGSVESSNFQAVICGQMRINCIIVFFSFILHSLRAQCHYVVGNFSKAVHDCTRSMMMSPHYFSDVQWLRAMCFYQMGIYYATWVDLR